MKLCEEHLGRIFEHFYRVDTRLTREVYGLGLGLTVCHRLVTLHQGRIWAESCPDGGSAFHIWLPL
jgi:signal transduction histidine kinase